MVHVNKLRKSVSHDNAVELGDFAWSLFWIILFVSPLSTLLPGNVERFFMRMMTLRRELGILKLFEAVSPY